MRFALAFLLGFAISELSVFFPNGLGGFFAVLFLLGGSLIIAGLPSWWKSQPESTTAF